MRNCSLSCNSSAHSDSITLLTATTTMDSTSENASTGSTQTGSATNIALLHIFKPGKKVADILQKVTHLPGVRM